MDATVQLNTRMNRELKEAGTVALAEIGLTPTRAINALWEKAAKRGKDLDEVASMLYPQRAVASGLPADDPFTTMCEQIDGLCDQLGIGQRSAPRDAGHYRHMLEDELWERWQENGERNEA